MDGDEPRDIVAMNKMQQIAANALKSKQKREQQAVDSAIASKVKNNPEEESKASDSGLSSSRGSKTAAKQPDNSNIAGLPEDMVCCICYNARKSVMIQTCKHLVFCSSCDRDYKLKNYMDPECPICRVKFKKTIPVLFS